MIGAGSINFIRNGKRVDVDIEFERCIDLIDLAAHSRCFVDVGANYYLVHAVGCEYNQYIRKLDIVNGEADITPCYAQNWGRKADHYSGLPGSDILKRLDELKILSTVDIADPQFGAGVRGCGPLKNGFANDDGGDFGWYPYIIKEINRLDRLLEQSEIKDIEFLIKRYYAGDDVLLGMKKCLAGITQTVINDFTFDTSGQTFTNLAGKFSKKIPKPDIRHGDDSPLGDPEDHRLFIQFEPFKFQQDDQDRVIDKRIIKALETYDPRKENEFKSWYYTVLKRGIQDLYKYYKYRWKNGGIIRSQQEMDQILKLRDLPGIDANIIYSGKISTGIVARLNKNQKKWLAIFLTMLPDRLTNILMAERISIHERTERRIRASFQQLLISYSQKLHIGIIQSQSDQDVIPREVCQKNIEHSGLLPECNNLICDSRIYYMHPFHKTCIEIRKFEEREASKNLVKNPAASERQKKMAAKYNEFTNREWQKTKYIRKSFPINPDNFNYKTGICSGSSFFPKNVKMSGLIE